MTNKTIKQLRPKLRQVAPLTFWICVGFGIVNAALWYLLTQASTAIRTYQVPITGNFLSNDVWAYWFLLIAIVMTYGLIRNNWTVIKRALVAGLVTKLMWAYALLYMILHGIPAVATLILWSFLAWVQAWTIVFFVPTIQDEQHDILPQNERFKDV